MVVQEARLWGGKIYNNVIGVGDNKLRAKM